MPFITSDRRNAIDKGLGVDNGMQPGDLCYVYYKRMVEKWKANPRWTTAHEIYKNMMNEIGDSGAVFNPVHGMVRVGLSENNVVAYQLAWQVFFQLYVIPYELKKREENGDI